MIDSSIARGKYRVPYSGGPGPLQSKPKAQPGSVGSHAGHIIRAHGPGHESLHGLWSDISPVAVDGTGSGDWELRGELR